MTKDLNELLPLVKEKAESLLSMCKSQGIDLVVTATYRSREEQDSLYAQGRTKPGSIVTNAKGGQSFHNWRVAVDVVPVINGKAVWDNNDLWEKVGRVGESLGFTWGGRWDFVDKSHFQLDFGYTFQDFIDGKVDFTKYAVKPQNAPQTTKPALVIPPISSDFAEDTRPIYKSASKVVFIALAITACFALFQGVIKEENFMLLATGAFSYYFANKKQN